MGVVHDGETAMGILDEPLLLMEVASGPMIPSVAADVSHLAMEVAEPIATLLVTDQNARGTLVFSNQLKAKT